MTKGFIILFSTLCIFAAQGETILIQTNAEFHLTLGTNESIWITRIGGGPDANFGATISFGAYSNEFGISGISERYPLALAGPCRFDFYNRDRITILSDDYSYTNTAAPVLIAYQRITNSPIKSIFVSSNQEPVIQVSSNETVHFLKSLFLTDYDDDEGPLRVQKDGLAVYDSYFDNAEYSGPLTITATYESEYDEPVERVVSYYIVEDFTVLPDMGFLQGPTGTFEIAVEKSVNLTNWYPVVLQRTSNDQKAFYRLRLGR